MVSLLLLLFGLERAFSETRIAFLANAFADATRARPNGSTDARDDGIDW